jgi:chromosome segregation and condensation protein ScpB
MSTPRLELARFAAELAKPGHGVMLHSVAGGYQLITKPEYHQELREVVENLPPPAPLSKAAVETAAIISLLISSPSPWPSSRSSAVCVTAKPCGPC